MRRVGVALCTLSALGGCLREPVFRGGPPDDGNSEGSSQPIVGVTAVSAGQGAEVAGSFFRMRFSGTGFHYPYSLEILDHEQLLQVADPGCANENGAGVAVYPAFTASGIAPDPSSMVTVTNATLAIALETGIAKIVIMWDATFPCMTAKMIGARSTFTFFPDGRIVRNDRLNSPATPSADSTSCPCVMDNSFYLTSFLMLRRSEITYLTVPIPTPGAIGTQVSRPTVCGHGLIQTVAFGFESNAARVRTPSSIDGYAFVYDMLIANPLGMVDRSTVTTMLLDDETFRCDGLEDRLDRLRSAPALRVSSAILRLQDSTDGIYGGEGRTTPAGFPTSDTTVLRSDNNQPIEGGFAVWLAFAGPRSTITVSRPEGSYLLNQVNGNQHAVIYFRDELAAGETITITAMP